MWTAIGAGSGFMVLLGIVLGMQNMRINKAQTKEMCDERHDNVEGSLKVSNVRCSKNDDLLAILTEKVNVQNGVLIEVRTILKRIEKNGRN